MEERETESTGPKKILRELGKLYLIGIMEQEILLEKTVDLWNKTALTCVRFLKKNGVPLKTLEKYIFKDKSKRRVIGEGVVAKSLLSSDDYKFFGQVAVRRDRVNNGLARRRMIDLVVELNPKLDRITVSRQITRNSIPKSIERGYIKGFVTPQATTSDGSAITIEQQFRCHIFVEEQFKQLRLRNSGVCSVSG